MRQAKGIISKFKFRIITFSFESKSVISFFTVLLQTNFHVHCVPITKIILTTRRNATTCRRVKFDEGRLRIKVLFASFRHQGQLIELSSILLTSFQIAPQQRLYHHTNNNNSSACANF